MNKHFDLLMEEIPEKKIYTGVIRYSCLFH